MNERDHHFLEMLALGRLKKGRSLWGKLSDYSKRALGEIALSRINPLFRDPLFSKSFSKQALENHLRCALINLMPRDRCVQKSSRRELNLFNTAHFRKMAVISSDLGKNKALSRIKAFMKNPRQTNLVLSDLSIPSLFIK